MKKMSIMDKLMSSVDKIAGPMTKFGQIPFVKGMVNGMISAVGVTMIGSIFLILFLLGSDGSLSKTALLPFLKPYAGDFILVNALTMNIMAIYMSITMGAEYADIKGINKTTGAVASFMAFLFLNYNSIGKLAVTGADGVITAGGSALSINYWGGAGVITAIVSMAISVNVIHFCYKHNIRIKLPSSVPPAISDSFSSIVPYLFIVVICWGLRTLLNINIPEFIGTMLLPLFSAADNIFVFTFAHFIMTLLWLVGLHGDSIVGAVTSTFLTTWMVENNTAFLAGQPIPHVWTANFNHIFMWVSTCWPILFYMFKSSKKLPHLKPLAAICAPSAVFSIVEPMMFGLPIVLNPFLMIPFLLTHTLTAALSYWLSSVGIIGKMCLSLPWATPSPILAYLGTAGNIGTALMVFVNFLIGLVIFYPFWNAYEKSELKRIEEENKMMAEVKTA